MSLKVNRTLDELWDQCIELGIDCSWCVNKTDYVDALRTYYLLEEYGDWDDVPKALKLILENIDSPMLCKKAEDVPKHIFDNLLDNPATYVDEKIDGCRMLLCFIRDKNGQMRFDAFSRNISVKTFLPINYGEKIDIDPQWYNAPDQVECILDCEIVCSKSNVQVQSKSAKTKTQLQSTAAILNTDKEASLAAQRNAPFNFIVFDCLWTNNKWLISEPLYKRSIIANALVDQMKLVGYPISFVPRNNNMNRAQKLALFKQYVDEGKEGIVLKNPNSTYSVVGNRTNDWVKMKRTMRGVLSDTIDAFVIGGIPGVEGKEREDQIASLKVAVFLEDGLCHHIATVCNFTDAEREAMTMHTPYGPKLNPEYYTKVMEIDGQDISSVNLRFMHAKMIRWRPDKTEDDCKMSKSDIEKFVL